MDLVFECALWGLGGAFIFGANQLPICLFSHIKEGGTKNEPLECIIEFVLALLVGAVAAAIWAQWAQAFLKIVGPGDLRGIAGGIGLIANPVSPILTGRFSTWIANKVAP